MTAERTTDRALIERFVFNNVMWERSREDNTTKEMPQEHIDSYAVHFILVSEGGSPIGLMMCHETLSHTLEIHIKIEDRQYAIQAVWESLKWIVDNTDYQKVVTWVPEIYPALRAFCKNKFGFIEEGCNRKSFLKKGKMHNMYLYGLTRDEIEVELCQH